MAGIRPMNNAVTPPTDPHPAIRFERVRIGFEEGDILRGVSFEVQQRETLVLLGETGTGKTLALKLAAGLLRPSGGNIQVLGRDVSSGTCWRSGGKWDLFFKKGRCSIR
jgi:ABC-type Fe3+/spermidine/putrescine transport system ATPase subunit